MKKIKENIVKKAANVSLALASQNVNSACSFWAYQSKLPQNADKLRKH